MHYATVKLKNGAERYQGLVHRDNGWQTCDHRHRFLDLAMTCSRRLAQRLHLDD